MHHGAFHPTLKLISEEEASPEVKQIYDEIKEFYNLDFVPKEYQVVANSPELLRENWEFEKRFYKGEFGVDPKIQAIIGLAISSVRSCPYLINWFTTDLKARGMSDAEILNLTNAIGWIDGYSTFYNSLQVESDVTPDLAEKMSSSPAIQSWKEMQKAA